MSRSYLKYRARAYHRQSGRCYYCSAKMWLGQPGNFTSQFNISRRDLTRFQCTAEHLTARQDGGIDEQENIVAACRFCNSNRHKMRRPLSAGAYRRRVFDRLKKSKWHPKHLHHVLQLSGE